MPADFLYALAPEHLVLAGVLLVMLLEMARVDPRWGRATFVAALLAALAAAVHQASAGFRAEVVPGEIVVDRLTHAGRIVLLLCGLGLAAGFRDPRSFKFWLLSGSSLLGGMLIVGSAGFASLFIGIELLSLPAFALMVLGAGGTTAAEGAFKYLVLSSVASALLLFGVSLAYGATGTLAIDDWARLLSEGNGWARAAGLLVLSALFLKAAVFPFHAWAPDAYAAARLPVTALLASGVKAAVALALVRVVSTAALDAPLLAVVALLALASIGFGNLAALAQKRFRRLLAYSSVAHAGYMIFVLLDTTGHRVDDLVMYAAIYALATLLACASFAILSPEGDDDLAALEGRFADRPVAAVLLAVAMLSLAGVPPFPGFFAKLAVFKSVVASGHLALAVGAFAGSFLGLAYYVGIVMRLFRTRAEVPAAPALDGRDETPRATA